MKKSDPLPEKVQQSVWGARAFYYFMFSLFYVCVVMYPNKLRDSFLQIGQFSSIIYILFTLGF